MSIYEHLPPAVEYAAAHGVDIKLTPREFRVRKLEPDNGTANRVVIAASVAFVALEHADANILLMWMQEVVKRYDEEMRRGTDDNRQAD